MLDSLKIRNFRMLSDFEVPKLGNVNLIVGKNNSGKSTVLEALRIFAAKGNPRSLMEIAIAHGEISANQARPESEMDEENTHPFRDFFYGRQFPGDDSSGPIYIGDRSEQDFVKIAHTLFVEEYEKITQGDGEEASVRKRKIVSKDDIGPDVVNAEQALIVSLSEVPHVGWIPLTEAISSMGMRRTPMSMFWERYAKDRPTSFVPTQFLSLDYLAHLWDLILFSPYAEEVKNALKILDDQFEDLAFIKTGSASYADRLNRYTRVKIPESDRTAVVKLKHLPKSIPLSSMGDGMLRVLQLALTIFPAKDGILLIDEFENGLHWSIQEKVWEMIFKLSADLNIQVFATTHSDDAVKAFSNVATKRREVGVLVKLVAKNSEQGPGKTIGVVYDEETLRTATLTETEVR